MMWFSVVQRMSSSSRTVGLFFTFWLNRLIWIALTPKSLYRLTLLPYLVAGLPLIPAFYVAISRYHDYKHDTTDVLGGALVGIAAAAVAWYASLGAFDSMARHGYLPNGGTGGGGGRAEPTLPA